VYGITDDPGPRWRARVVRLPPH